MCKKRINSIYMDKIKIKFKILAYGFPLTKEEFKIDNFILKHDKINDINIEKNLKNHIFDTSPYLLSCSYELEDEKGLFYNYFESIDYIEVDTKGIDIRYDLLTETNILNYISFLEKKLRLQFNSRISLPISYIKVYDMNNKYIISHRFDKTIPITRGLLNFDSKKFEINSHIHIDISAFMDLSKNNNRFNRAVNFFFDSFDSDNIGSRFLMLISSLESLLVPEDKGVTEIISKRCSFILKYTNKLTEDKFYKEIRRLYKLRSEYIHGNDTVIKKEDEDLLREYARNILILYWNQSFYNKDKVDDYIINIIKNKEDFNIGVQLFANYLYKIDYKEAYLESINRIVENINKNKVIIKKENDNVIKEVTENN